MAKRIIVHDTNPYLEKGPNSAFNILAGTDPLDKVRSAEIDQTVLTQRVYMDQARCFEELKRIMYRDYGIIEGAMELFMYLYSNCDRQNMTSVYNVRKQASAMNISERYMYNLLSILIGHGLIARSVQDHTYFLNPYIIPDGRKLVVVKEYIVGEKPENDDYTPKDKSSW